MTHGTQRHAGCHQLLALMDYQLSDLPYPVLLEFAEFIASSSDQAFTLAINANPPLVFQSIDPDTSEKVEVDRINLVTLVHYFALRGVMGECLRRAENLPTEEVDQ